MTDLLLGKKRRGASVAIAFVAIIIVMAAALGAATVLSSSANQSSSSANPCEFPSYLTNLASRVQADSRFTAQSHDLSYALAYGDNESGTTGQVGGKPYSTPPDTALTFYSYGGAQVTACPSALGDKGIVGVLWVHVPLATDGSYNLANMTVYFTPGLFTNSTATTWERSGSHPVRSTAYAQRMTTERGSSHF